MAPTLRQCVTTLPVLTAQSAGAAIIAVLQSEQREADHEDRHRDPASFVPGPWDNMEIQMLVHFLCVDMYFCKMF